MNRIEPVTSLTPTSSTRKAVPVTALASAGNTSGPEPNRERMYEALKHVVNQPDVAPHMSQSVRDKIERLAQIDLVR